MRKVYILLLMFPSHAIAEVMDKMASTSELWLASLLLGLAYGFLSFWKKWMAVAGFFCFFGLTLGTVDWHNDELFYNAVIKEAGVSYVYHSYASALLVLCLTVCGLIAGMRKDRGKAT